MNRHRIVRCFKRGNRLLSGHAWEGVQELIEAMVPFQIVDQVPERHARPNENWRPTQNLGVAVHDG